MRDRPLSAISVRPAAGDPRRGWLTADGWTVPVALGRGGILVNVDGVNAFVPLSQIDSVRRDDPDASNQLANLVGQSIRLKVIELNRKRNRVILSERAAMAEVRKEQKDRVLEELQEGQIRTGKVSSITDFGVFVDLGGADGLVHLSEISWDRTKTPEELFKLGDEVDVYVMKVDNERKKIALSIRRAQPAHWDGIVDKYQVGEVVPGIVTKLATFGAFARIEGPVEGLIHVSELVDRRISHSQEAVREGDILPLKIIRIERDRHRLGLSLKQARDRGEYMGFRFTQEGEVTYVPDDIKALAVPVLAHRLQLAGTSGAGRAELEGAVAELLDRIVVPA